LTIARLSRIIGDLKKKRRNNPTTTKKLLKMLEIDGSYLEGGGQILRTALSLSLITNKPVRIFNIRKKRPQPGLKNQHLAVIKALTQIFSSQVEGAYLGSQEIRFFPNQIKGRVSLNIDIGTAGSVGLLIQAILPAIIFSKNLEISLQIKGGTAGKWAIPCDYYPYIVFPLLEIKADLQILRRGYYPKGGGLVKLRVASQKLKALNFLERGKSLKIKILSIASQDLKLRKVSERALSQAEKNLKERYRNIPVEGECLYSETYSSGLEVNICFYFEKTRLWSDSLGERRKTSEEVGREASQKLIQEESSGACVDRHLADNLIPYLAFSRGSFKTSEITNHTLTNIKIVEQFLGKIFEVKDNVVRRI